MVVEERDAVQSKEKPVYDRLSELKAFDDTKLGVKGLVDSGLTKIPRIFHHDPHHNLSGKSDLHEPQLGIPTIDLEGINKDYLRRATVVGEILEACENWGFFQVVNHGIPVSLMDEMIDGVRRFHEQDDEVKKATYTRDYGSKKVLYNSNFDLFSAPAANWRDTLVCVVAPHPPQPEEIPAICRNVIIEYNNQVMKLGLTLFELLSEALGLNPDHLKDMACAEGLILFGHYYPQCPEPELTMATSNHSDSGFMTILLQDQIGGLQVLHEDRWVDVPYVPGALIINIADLLQLITNDKFKSVNHRVLANKIGPRISVACFFRTQQEGKTAPRVYRPISELVSDKNPAVYRETTIKEYVNHYYTKGLDGTSGLLHFRL